MQGDFLFGNDKEKGGVYIWVKEEAITLDKNNRTSMIHLISLKGNKVKKQHRRRNNVKGAICIDSSFSKYQYIGDF